MQAAVCPRFNYSTSQENRMRFLKISQRREQGSFKAMGNEPVYDTATRYHVLIRFY
jgi:hypothetical protein